MRLPNAEESIIDDRKVRDYLLAADHPVGGAKAGFFHALGYSQIAWRALKADIRAMSLMQVAERGGLSPYGAKFLVRGILRGPNGKSARIDTAWIILAGEVRPRFVSAWPGGLL